MRRILMTSCAMLFVSTATLRGQPNLPKIKIVKLTVSPSPASEPSLRYALLPHLRDLKPGNAAVFYQRSQSLEWWGPSMRKEIDKIVLLLEKPWDKSAAEPFRWLHSFGAIKEIAIAARCESCDWQMLDRLRAEGQWMVVPDSHSMRTLGMLNSVRTRAEIHEGRFDEAAEDLRTAFAMAKHVGEAPILINYLVGSAIANMGRERLVEWVQRPDAPNLFWPLVDLPEQLIDLRRPLQSESVMMEPFFADIRKSLREAKPTPIPIATLRKKFADLESELRMAPRWSAHVYEFARVQPAARAHFEKRGLSPEDIEALPVTQLGMMYYMSRFDSQSIEVERALNLPYWQALPLLKKMEERFAADSIEFPDIPPFHRSFSYRTFFQSQASSRRGFAMLRHVEALRLYAADHGGRLPDSLDELRDLPLPVDPFTGRSFAYRLENGTAILESLVPAFVALRYEIKIRGSNP